jgi:hypothetical protein
MTGEMVTIDWHDLETGGWPAIHRALGRVAEAVNRIENRQAVMAFEQGKVAERVAALEEAFGRLGDGAGAGRETGQRMPTDKRMSTDAPGGDWVREFTADGWRKSYANPLGQYVHSPGYEETDPEAE